jgi:hypothetical protein
LALPSPLALAENPTAVLTLTFATVPPLALALVPAAVFALFVALLALAFVPHAKLSPAPAAVAPAPLAVAGGTVEPSVLPTQTNCACAGGAPRLDVNAIASAALNDEIKDNRMQGMFAPPPQQK